jgi:hypothetical protein
VHQLDPIGWLLRRRFLTAFQRELDRRWPGGYSYLAPHVREETERARQDARDGIGARRPRHGATPLLLVGSYRAMRDLVPSHRERLDILAIAFEEAHRIALPEPLAGAALDATGSVRHALPGRLLRWLTAGAITLAASELGDALELRYDPCRYHEVFARLALPELADVVCAREGRCNAGGCTPDGRGRDAGLPLVLHELATRG